MKKQLFFILIIIDCTIFNYLVSMEGAARFLKGCTNKDVIKTLHIVTEFIHIDRFKKALAQKKISDKDRIVLLKTMEKLGATKIIDLIIDDLIPECIEYCDRNSFYATKKKINSYGLSNTLVSQILLRILEEYQLIDLAINTQAIKETCRNSKRFIKAFFTPDGRFLIYLSRDNYIFVLDLKNKKQEFWEGGQEKIVDFVFMDNESEKIKSYCCTSDEQATIKNVKMAVGPYNEAIVISKNNEKLYILTHGFTKRFRVEHLTETICYIEPFEQLVYVGLPDLDLQTIDLSCEEYEPLSSGKYRATAASPDSTTFCAQTLDGTIEVWNSTQIPFKYLHGIPCNGALGKINYSDQGNLLTGFSLQEKMLYVWDVMTGNSLLKAPLNPALFENAFLSEIKNVLIVLSDSGISFYKINRPEVAQRVAHLNPDKLLMVLKLALTKRKSVSRMPDVVLKYLLRDKSPS